MNNLLHRIHPSFVILGLGALVTLGLYTAMVFSVPVETMQRICKEAGGKYLSGNACHDEKHFIIGYVNAEYARNMKEIK